MKQKLSELISKKPEKEEKDESVSEKEPENKEEKEIYEREKFFILSTFGELLDLAIHLQEVERKKVVLMVPDNNYKKIGDGIIEKAENWHEYLGKGWIFVVDGCENAKLQDWLREQGEYVVGTNAVMSDLENDRQKGQALFRKAGFKQPISKNFKSIDDAIVFVAGQTKKRWVLKQNGDASKSINHVGKFEGNEDMLFHLEELKKGWNDLENGAFDCDLMEFVEGVEVAASAFFNGHDFLRDSRGRVVGFLNFEHKKEKDGDLGATTGEMGTLFNGVDESNKIFRDIIMRKEILEVLRESNYRGVFDLNGSLTDDGFICFEATSRFGIPATSYEFMEGLKSSTADLLCAMACGEAIEIDIQKGWGMVQVIVAPPFPVEVEVQKEATSAGERLWILNDGKPVTEFSADQRKHIHLENFFKDDQGHYKIASKSGYILTVTGRGKTIENTRESLLKYIKDNLYLSSMSYRTDLGKRIENEL